MYIWWGAPKLLHTTTLYISLLTSLHASLIIPRICITSRTPRSAFSSPPFRTSTTSTSSWMETTWAWNACVSSTRSSLISTRSDAVSPASQSQACPACHVVLMCPASCSFPSSWTRNATKTLRRSKPLAARTWQRWVWFPLQAARWAWILPSTVRCHRVKASIRFLGF